MHPYACILCMVTCIHPFSHFSSSVVGHQRFERVLASLRARVAELDASIISFARTLGEHEQILHQQVTDSKKLTNIQGEVTQR